MFVLMVTVCLLGGDCYSGGFEAFQTEQECYLEAQHQQSEGFPMSSLSCIAVPVDLPEPAAEDVL